MQTDNTPPETFLCCITQTVMQDPVMDPEGNTYERHAIEQWLTNRCAQSPITRSPLYPYQLAPNRALRDLIQASEWGAAIATTEAPQGHPMDIAAPTIYTSTSILTVERVGKPAASVVTETSSAEKVPPKHVQLLVDTSGSMGSEVSNGDEQTGLTLLCIVKHAVRTVLAMLRPEDYVTIITFNSVTSVVGSSAVSMSDTAAVEALKREFAVVTPTGMTNMWAGLQHALDVARDTNARHPNLHTNIMLLTDGLPNPEPPRGTDNMFGRWCDQFSEEAKHITVSTFGFGYRLNSSMLRSIANTGNGMYAFTPDSTFTGTVFIHAIASILSTLQSHAMNGGVSGGVLIAQPRSAMCQDVQVVSETSVCATLYERPIVVEASSHQAIPLSTSAEMRLPALKMLLETQAERKIAQCLRSLLEVESFDGAKSTALVESTVSELRLLCNELNTDPSTQGCGGVDAIIAHMIEDMTGQVTKAVSRKDWWDRWGVYYLGSLLSAYDAQTCNNFKDPGLQNNRFCGPFMQDLRDRGDDIFVTLPPPVPPVTLQYNRSRCGGVQPNVVHRQPVDMAQYHNSSDPGCFSGDSIVSLADGSTCLVQNLNANCIVEAQDTLGNPIPGGAKVLCVLEVRDIATDITYVNPGLRITPTHPIRNGSIRNGENQQWVHPHQASSSTSVTNVVFNVVLEKGASSFTVGNTVCVSLGHMILDDLIASHDYLGTEAVTQDLAKCRGWEQGRITMSGAWLQRGGNGYCTRILFNAEM